MKNILIILSILLISFVLRPEEVTSHSARSIYFDLEEVETHQYVVKWKFPEIIPVENLPKIIFPEGTLLFSGDKEVINYTGVQHYKCPTSIVGKEIFIHFPNNISFTIIIRLRHLNGEEVMHVMEPLQPVWVIPERETKSSVAKQYTLLGMEHIFGGVDHLLFLVCLIFIAKTGKRILIAVTGFTLAHSITLILSALGWVVIPVEPVEAVIALSILFLATELIRGNDQSLTFQYPIVVAISFGLLHGFGFASALKEIGLPQVQLLIGLIFFNVGVEIGQILFVVFFFILLSVLKRLFSVVRVERLQRSVVYIVGMLSSYWMIQRIALFWA